MGRVLRIFTIFSFLCGAIGVLNSMNFMTTSIKTSKTTVESSNFPLEFSAKISISPKSAENLIENSDESPLSFSVSVKITEEKLIFFRTKNFSDLFFDLNYEDFSEIFSKFDGVWWYIDLWDEEVSEKLGEGTAEFFRNFIEDFDEYEKSELKQIEKSFVEDEIFVKISIDFFEDSFETPEEYSDFANFFVETFEIE